MSSAETLGRFVWHELLTSDTAGAAAFYQKVLPWRTAPSSMPGYTIWMVGQTQIGGLMALPADGGATPPHWLVYLGTPKVDDTCAQATSLGGRIVKPAVDIPNVGRFAVLADPQGATFAVFTGSSSPPAADAVPGAFTWHELATTDVPAALRFYGELFGWRKGPGHDMGDGIGVYQIFEQGGRAVGGMCRPGAAHTAPSWLSYVNVADANRAVAAVKSGGGRLLHGPIEVPGGSWIALLVDPQGGSFAVQEVPRAAAQAKPATVAAAKPTAAPKPAPAAAPKAAAPAARPAAQPAKAVAPVTPPAKPAAAPPAKAAKKTAKKAAKKAARKKVGKAKKPVKKPARKAARKKTTRGGSRRVKRTASRRRSGRR